MKNSIVRLHLTAVLLAALAIPALADGNPIPWPKKPGQPSPVVAVRSPKLVADGNPIPWPKKPGQPSPRPAVSSPSLLADGNPIPWPRKSGLGSVTLR